MDKHAPKDTKFLYEEFKHCCSMLRYYDQLQSGYLKYSVTLSTTVLALVTSILKLFPESGLEVNEVLVLIFVSLFIGNLLMTLMMVRNRIYYVFCANQVSAIRRYLIENEIPDFLSYNKMYLSSLTGAKLMSTQMILIWGVSLYATFSLWGSLYFLGLSVMYSIIISVLYCLFVGILAFDYIKRKTDKKSDEAINSKI